MLFLYIPALLFVTVASWSSKLGSADWILQLRNGIAGKTTELVPAVGTRRMGPPLYQLVQTLEAVWWLDCWCCHGSVYCVHGENYYILFLKEIYDIFKYAFCLKLLNFWHNHWSADLSESVYAVANGNCVLCGLYESVGSALLFSLCLCGSVKYAKEPNFTKMDVTTPQHTFL